MFASHNDKTKPLFQAAAIMGVLLAAVAAPGLAQTPLGTEFTYQGRLLDGGSPVNDTADFQFLLWDDPSVGLQIGSTQAVNNVSVVDGLFTVDIDFGVAAFNGDERWLEIAVRSPAGGGGYTTLAPRQPLAPTPYAVQTRGIFVDDMLNVGIGTTAPQTPFSLMGNGGTFPVGITQNAVGGAATMELTTTDSLGNQASRIVMRGGSGGDTADIEFYTGAQGAETQTMIIDGATGNVGIGTSTPLDLFHVEGDSFFRGFLNLDTLGSNIHIGETGTQSQAAGWDPNPINPAKGVWLESGEDESGGFYADGDVAVIWSPGDVDILRVFDEDDLPNGDPVFVIDPLGNTLIPNNNLGIGTDVPSGRLHVANGTNPNVIFENFGDNAGARSVSVKLNHSNGTGAQLTATRENGDDDGMNLQFHTQPVGGSLTERMRIDPNGLVGIGTTTPAYALHVVSPETDVARIEGDNSVTTRLSIRNTGVGGQTWRLASTANGSTIGGGNFAIIEEGTVRVAITPGGNVGLNRVPTTNRLEVAGDASKNVAGNWLANSDRRIKTNVETVEGALDAIDKVRLVSFDYTDDYLAEHDGIESRRYVNVIAQEFAEVFPDSVKGSGERLPDGSEIVQVDTYPLTIYSAAAIKELHEQLKSKAAEFDEMKKENAALADRLARIEAMLQNTNGGVR